MGPLKFTPILKSALWGGNIIPRMKSIEPGRTDIGESWEISDVDGSRTVVSCGVHKGKTIRQLMEQYGAEMMGTSVMKRFGNRFPLLLKIIDAHRDLSIQVHPDDTTASRHGHPSGKAEMWYILDSLPGSKIYAGFNGKVDDTMLRRAINGNTMMDHVEAYDSEPGQVYYLAPGCVHAIGSGNLLVEIQQSSDITYRLYDYGRRDADGNLRQLHIEKGLDSIDYDCKERARIERFEAINDEGDLCLSSNDYFIAHLVGVDGERELINGRDSFMLLTAIAGEVTIECNGYVETLRSGHSIFIPASCRRLTFRGAGKLLSFTV